MRKIFLVLLSSILLFSSCDMIGDNQLYVVDFDTDDISGKISYNTYPFYFDGITVLTENDLNANVRLNPLYKITGWSVTGKDGQAVTFPYTVDSSCIFTPLLERKNGSEAVITLEYYLDSEFETLLYKEIITAEEIGEDDCVNHPLISEEKLIEKNPSLEGLSLISWQNEEDLKSYDYNEKISWATDPVERFYAITDKKQYKITYYNYESLIIYSDTYTGLSPVDIKLKEAMPIKYYNFIGWYSDPEYSSEQWTCIPAGTTGDINLYAKYEAIRYSIKYDDLTEEEIEKYNLPLYHSADEIRDLTIYDIIRDGNHSKNFFTSRGGYWADRMEKTKPEYGDIVLYCDFVPFEFTLTFVNVDGVENFENQKGFDYGEVIELEDIYRDGYRFLGWYTDPSCAEEYRVTSIKMTEDVVLWAGWEEAWNLKIYHDGEFHQYDYDTGESVNLVTEFSQIMKDSAECAEYGYEILGYTRAFSPVYLTMNNTFDGDMVVSLNSSATIVPVYREEKWNGAADTSWYDNDKSYPEGYHIYTAAQLYGLGVPIYMDDLQPSNCLYAKPDAIAHGIHIENDLDFGGRNFKGLGTSDIEFSCNFYGNNHTFYNFKTDTGLLAWVAGTTYHNGKKLSNLNIEGLVVDPPRGDKSHPIGAIIGSHALNLSYNEVPYTIENVSIKGTDDMRQIYVYEDGSAAILVGDASRNVQQTPGTRDFGVFFKNIEVHDIDFILDEGYVYNAFEITGVLSCLGSVRYLDANGNKMASIENIVKNNLWSGIRIIDSQNNADITAKGSNYGVAGGSSLLYECFADVAEVYEKYKDTWFIKAETDI